jgi:hypothetical protein
LPNSKFLHSKPIIDFGLFFSNNSNQKEKSNPMRPTKIYINNDSFVNNDNR